LVNFLPEIKKLVRFRLEEHFFPFFFGVKEMTKFVKKEKKKKKTTLHMIDIPTLMQILCALFVNHMIFDTLKEFN
jgi:hypothetical protein